MTAELAHSPLGPSAADRWLNCPGSVAATAGITDKSSVYAAEGNFAHDLSEKARLENQPAKHYIGHKDTVDGFEFECDADMAQHIQFFLDYEAQFEADERLVEERVQYNAWVDEGFGTLDAGILNDGTCIIIDLKYGKGFQIFAENNTQLKLYALGVYQEYYELYDIKQFKLSICQPRLNHIDEWTVSVDELLVWAEEVVEPAADLTAKEDAPFKAGTHCQWCKIKSSCVTRAEAYKEMMLDEISDIRDPVEMENAELGELASLIPLMQKWAKDVMAQVEKMVLAGEEIIGSDGKPFKMVAGRGLRKWRDEAEAEKAMRNYKLKVADIFTKKLISPAQAEKLKSIGKGHPIMQKHCIKSHGKPALVPGSDKREAYKASTDEMDVIDE